MKNSFLGYSGSASSNTVVLWATEMGSRTVSSERYRILLVQESGGELIPVGRRRRRARSHPPDTSQAYLHDLGVLEVLLSTLNRLGRRGDGPSAWAPVFENDPLAFLLDTMSDAFIVRGLDGQVLFDNPPARQLGLSERPFSAFEEFEQGGEAFQGRGLQVNLPGGQICFTIVSRRRR